MSELIDKSEPGIDTSNEKKQNDILARREARRKRILENAKTRLDKLSNANRDGSPTNKYGNRSTETYSDPEIEYPEYMNNYNHTYSTTTSTTNHVDWDSTHLINTPLATPLTKFEKILSTRTHIVVASALTYTMLFLGLNIVISQSLFALFLALECVELVLFRRERPLSPIVNMVLMLSGINISKAGPYIKLMGILNKMLCDLGLFVFCFVVCHGVYSVFVGGTVDESFYSF